jgi:chaperone modulatory protein CbpM
MATKETVSGIVLDERIEFTLGDVCEACAVQTEWIVTLVEEGVLDPMGQDPSSWRFTGAQLRSARTVSRLQRDLGINLAGAALALELIDEIETLRERLAALEFRQ